MMITSQTKAFRLAHAQLLRVEQPEERAPLGHDEARPKGGTGRPGCAHPAVSVPVMFG